MIQVLDPYYEHYAFEKATNPNAKLVWRQFRKKHVDKVDQLVKLAQGDRDTIKSEKDWEILRAIIVFFAEEWPDEFSQFKATIPDIRETRMEGGYSKSREIKYLGAMPARLIKMIKIIFPFQEFNKEFMYKFIKRFPLFKVGGVQNHGGGGIIL